MDIPVAVADFSEVADRKSTFLEKISKQIFFLICKIS